MVVGWTMTKVLTGQMDSIHVYTDSLRRGYNAAVKHNGMFNLTAGGSRQGLKAANALIEDIASSTLFDGDGDVGGRINMERARLSEPSPKVSVT